MPYKFQIAAFRCLVYVKVTTVNQPSYITFYETGQGSNLTLAPESFLVGLCLYRRR